LENGAYRIADTRIPLELVIHSFDEGDTPETIVQDFSSLRLADVYAVLTYYLTHRKEIERYMRETEADVAAIRKEIEAHQPPRPGFGAELRARYEKMMRDKDAPVS
jgi:uncharacterized protein (DUF433 family)